MANNLTQPGIENVFKVKLQHPFDRTRRVVFEVTPDLIENRNVNYKTLDPVHMPGQIYVYGSTASRTFNVSNIRFISRTPLEAQRNLERLQLLRFWCMPRFGKYKSSLDDPNKTQRLDSFQPSSYQQETAFSDRGFQSGAEQLGQPPDVILLSAYSNVPREAPQPSNAAQTLGHLNRVPCVIQQVSIPYPSDVDYIPTSENGVPMPTIMTLDMTLAETHSPAEYENFSLADFKNGTLRGF